MAPGVSADGSKLCPGCHKILETAMFGTNRRRPDGLAYYCKECFRSIHTRSYRKRKAAAGLTVREPRVSPPGHRWCPDCEAHVPLTDFGLNATSNSGLSGYCLKHQAIRSVESRRKKHGSVRSYHLQFRYGVTEDDVDEMLERQAGLCPICRRGLGDKPHVDHDHTTGEVRGLLCFTCNVGLGNFSDDVERLSRAATYLAGTLTAPSRVADGVYEVAGTSWRRDAQTTEDVSADG